MYELMTREGPAPLVCEKRFFVFEPHSANAAPPDVDVANERFVEMLDVVHLGSPIVTEARGGRNATRVGRGPENRQIDIPKAIPKFLQED